MIVVNGGAAAERTVPRRFGIHPGGILAHQQGSVWRNAHYGTGKSIHSIWTAIAYKGLFYPYALLPPPLTQHYDRHLTPEIAPIDHDTSTLNITPFLNGLIEIADQHLDEFFLEADCTLTLELHPKHRHHPATRSRTHNDSLLLLHVDNLLEDIVEESDCDFNSYEDSCSHEF